MCRMSCLTCQIVPPDLIARSSNSSSFLCIWCWCIYLLSVQKRLGQYLTTTDVRLYLRVRYRMLYQKVWVLLCQWHGALSIISSGYSKEGYAVIFGYQVKNGLIVSWISSPPLIKTIAQCLRDGMWMCGRIYDIGLQITFFVFQKNECRVAVTLPRRTAIFFHNKKTSYYDRVAPVNNRRTTSLKGYIFS